MENSELAEDKMTALAPSSPLPRFAAAGIGLDSLTPSAYHFKVLEID